MFIQTVKQCILRKQFLCDCLLSTTTPIQPVLRYYKESSRLQGQISNLFELFIPLTHKEVFVTMGCTPSKHGMYSNERSRKEGDWREMALKCPGHKFCTKLESHRYPSVDPCPCHLEHVRNCQYEKRCPHFEKCVECQRQRAALPRTD